MELNMQEMLFTFVGGLGIFLFGIKSMGDGLQKAAGDRLRDILDRFTSNPFMAVLAGIIVTILIQSSSGTTVITVGLVSAGFITLRQAIGIIMGANIGTTVTAFIIGIKISDYSLPIIAIGAVLLFFFKSKKIHNIGTIVFGFGALFYGLDLMGSGMKPLTQLEAFKTLTLEMSDNPILGVVVGTVLTVVVQSSSATIGILQELYDQGAIELSAALPVLFGDNIGTTITAVLASIGAIVAAKRTAVAHVLFNLIGALIFSLGLGLFTKLILMFQATLDLNPKMTIAFAHGTFNVTNTLIQLPFLGALAYVVTKIVPGKDSTIEYKPKHLDPLFIEQSASIALQQAREEVKRMAEFTQVGLKEASTYFMTGQNRHMEVALQLEDAINNLDKRITGYLVKLSSVSLTDEESAEHMRLLNTVRDLERIGDHFENIVELAESIQLNKVHLTEETMADVKNMFEVAEQALTTAIASFEARDEVKAREVFRLEDQIDNLERRYRKQHLLRLKEGKYSPEAGAIYVDVISNLERIGDHTVNIAEAVLGVRD
ncbi:MAG: Na/Pi cotransporter family protein [Bacilli bacterium]